MARRATLRGSTLRNRTLEEKATAARRVEKQVLPLFEEGKLTVPIAATYPLDQVEDAYARFEAGGKLGKIVLLP
jgi:NADPH:quinone reductase